MQYITYSVVYKNINFEYVYTIQKQYKELLTPLTLD